MKILRVLSGLIFVKTYSSYLHHVCIKLILVLINYSFFLLNKIVLFNRIIFHQVKCSHNILLCFSRHTIHDCADLCKSKLRVPKETLLKQIKIRLVFNIIR